MERLSPSELSILWTLWKKSPLSVRELHDAQGSERAYTTTKTLMDRMAAKGLLERRSVHGVNVYEPTISRAQGLAGWARFFADQILGVDHSQVVNMFSESSLYSDEDIEEMRKLLDKEAGKSGTKRR